MKKYCFDTSGISNPLEHMPEDIHVSMWANVRSKIDGGIIAVTTEIYTEMHDGIYGGIGDHIRSNGHLMILEVGDSTWDWQSYVANVERMRNLYRPYISEYCGGSRKTICLNDVSIIALAKTLNLPVVSMENLLPAHQSITKRRIPNICQSESISHMPFSDFLRSEKVNL